MFANKNRAYTRPAIAKNIAVATSKTDHTACTGALSCIQACPTGARFRKEDKTELDAKLWIGCGICVDVCEQGAIQIVEHTAEIYVPANALPTQEENRG